MRMKTIFTFAIVLVTVILSNAQVPQLINYQGKLKDASGNPVDDTVKMQFSMYDAETGGTGLWAETQTVQVTDGLFNVLLGSVNPIPYSVFSGAEVYLELKVRSDPAMTPRQRLVSVGYAMHADDADKLGGNNAANFVRSVDGVSPQNGNIDLVEGSNVTIESDPQNKTITISAAGGSGGGDLTLPYTGTTESSATAFSVTNTGTGRAGYFKINNSSNNNQAIYGETNGLGRVGHFRITNANNNLEAVAASTQGGGPALSGYTVGSGYAVYGRTDGAGEAGHFEINNSSNSTYALYGETNGTGTGVYGKHSSSGNYGSLGGFNYGVRGVSAENFGVYGSCTTAQGTGIYGYGTKSGIIGASAYGVAVEGRCSNGDALRAEGDLYVTGAYRGDISSTSGSDGAPFPRPAYDSGWISIDRGEKKVLTHNIGKDVDNYVVDMQIKSTTIDNYGISNRGVGGDDAGAIDFKGVFWQKLTTNTITVTRKEDDSSADFIRIRIWYYN